MIEHQTFWNLFNILVWNNCKKLSSTLEIYLIKKFIVIFLNYIHIYAENLKDVLANHMYSPFCKNFLHL